MRKYGQYIFLLVLFLALLGCDTGFSHSSDLPSTGGSGGGSGASINGTYYGTGSYADEAIKLDNGNWTVTVSYGTNLLKGTYTTSGSNLTFTTTHLWYQTQWYSRSELAGMGASNSELNQYFITFTATISGNTLTISASAGGGTYTKR